MPDAQVRIGPGTLRLILLPPGGGSATLPPMFRIIAAALLGLAAPANAADRRFAVGSFDRVRVDGPFDVRITTGASPRASVSGDGDLVERVDIAAEGNTLVVRARRDRWAERPTKAATTPLTVTLSTPALATIVVLAGARVRVNRMVAPRIALSVGGSGTIAVAGIVSDRLTATLIGAGGLTLAGRAGVALLSTNGPGSIDAAGLQADDLTVRLDGNGETKVAARYTATITNVGIGRVIVAGSPKCVVKADAGGPVSCGR